MYLGGQYIGGGPVFTITAGKLSAVNGVPVAQTAAAFKTAPPSTVVVVPPVGTSPVQAPPASTSVGGAELPAGELVSAAHMGIPVQAAPGAGGKTAWPDGTGGAWRWETFKEWWRRYVRHKE